MPSKLEMKETKLIRELYKCLIIRLISVSFITARTLFIKKYRTLLQLIAISIAYKNRNYSMDKLLQIRRLDICPLYNLMNVEHLTHIA